MLLRGGSKDVLNEIERNLQDAMQVVRNVLFDPRMLPGGGATELAISTAIAKGADQVRSQLVSIREIRLIGVCLSARWRE